MGLDTGSERLSVVGRDAPIRSAVRDLFDQEFSYSTGHVAAVLNTCLFAPSLLTFWFVNGVLDFSTALAIGAVATPAGLQIRLLAYVLLVPTFLTARVAVHLLHPAHRRQVLAGSCPNTRLLSLDWFSMGILATGLPLALQNFGPWVAMNGVFLLGLFIVPRIFPESSGRAAKLITLVGGSLLFVYANYGGVLPVVPHPSTVLGPVATFRLTDQAVEWLLRLVNSVVFGPVLVGIFGVTMNHVLTRPELTDIPLIRYALPRRDPDTVVSVSAATGTIFYLGVLAAATGQLILFP